jgi:primosomal protein N' (replication factor Y)
MFFSKMLLSAIDERIKKNEGVILLQNRRGFATQVYCVECAHLEKCENCSVGMVYHIKSNNLKCHYCNAIKPMPKACSMCGSKNIKLFGTGTERVEDELQAYFPSAIIERIDSDTISEKGKLGETLNKFRDGEIDILVGTQMVSKGLDFPRVTLVGGNFCRIKPLDARLQSRRKNISNVNTSKRKSRKKYPSR